MSSGNPNDSHRDEKGDESNLDASRKLRVAAFLSGGGRTLANLIKHQRSNDLPIDITLVISSNGKAKGLQIAEDAGIETLTIRKSNFSDPGAYRDAMFDPCDRAGVDLVVMAGFLKHVLIPDRYNERVINIHPSLLPKFGGEGMYGGRVHQAVIDGCEQQTGCTVHYVDNQYDNGPMILQRTCRVMPGETADELAARVFELECQTLPAALRKLANQHRG